MLTGQASTQALQVVHAHISSLVIYVSINDRLSSWNVLFLAIFRLTSVNLSRVSIMILRGDNNLPVIFAGQAAVHRPHSVQVYASNRFFQVKSCTSFTPKRLTSPAGGGREGSSIAFTSAVTDSILLNFPFGAKLEK